MQQPMHDALAAPSGPVILAGFDTAATPLAERSKTGKLVELPTDAARLNDLQTRLYAEAAVGARRRILLVLQGMDTSGKGGVTNHVVGVFEPIGVQYHAFKKPTEEELAHDFLWRIRKHLPGPGIIGVFDRSHYEDVLVPRVHDLVPIEEIERRYDAINDFEAEAEADGTTIVKCFLHISYDTQRNRLRKRLDDPTKHWKFNEGDLTERAHWTAYQSAYEHLIARCSSPTAPWFIVPGDSKRYRNWAVAELLRETLEALDPQYPDPHLNIEELRARLEAPN